MLRITKLADYAFVILTEIIRAEDAGPHTARSLSDITALPLPTVTKILKQLTRAKVLRSQRGALGGYICARPPGAIAVTEIIAAMEGPIALMTCCLETEEPPRCDMNEVCPVSNHWRVINHAMVNTLKQLSLADLIAPLSEIEGRFHHTLANAGR